jgi:hypothetical protein
MTCMKRDSMVPVVVEEDARFCYRCGGSLGEEPGTLGVCQECGARWERLYTNDCLNCGKGHGFTHLGPAFRVRLSRDRVTQAQGLAQCDGCHDLFLYYWSAAGPRLVLVGFGVVGTPRSLMRDGDDAVLHGT